MSRPLTRETSTHSRHSSTERVRQLRHSSTERVPQWRHSSTERVTLLKHSSTERVTQLRHSSTERVPLLKHSSTERNPLLKRSSTETFHLTRMSPLRHLFTEMCYYNKCPDLWRKSLPHATINWCNWLDFKNVIPHIFFLEQKSSRKEQNFNVFKLLQYWPIFPRDNWSNYFSPLSFILSS